MAVIPNGQLLSLVNCPLEKVIKTLEQHGFVRSHQAYDKPEEVLCALEKELEPNNNVVAVISFLSSDWSPIQVNLKVKIYNDGALLTFSKALEYQAQITNLLFELFNQPKLEFYLEV